MLLMQLAGFLGLLSSLDSKWGHALCWQTWTSQGPKASETTLHIITHKSI